MYENELFIEILDDHIKLIYERFKRKEENIGEKKFTVLFYLYFFFQKYKTKSHHIYIMYTRISLWGLLILNVINQYQGKLDVNVLMTPFGEVKLNLLRYANKYELK